MFQVNIKLTPNSPPLWVIKPESRRDADDLNQQTKTQS